MTRPLVTALGLACALTACDPPRPPPTWHRDVLPIVQARCQGCHTPGGIAPFPLRGYQDASLVHVKMAAAVASGKMPPWMPSEDCSSFKDSRQLSSQEIDALTRWSADGAPEGDPADAPAAPEPAAGLPWVDTELSSAATPYIPTPPAGGSDDYHCFILDPALTADRFLIGYDLQPGVRQTVHHVLLFSADAAAAKAKDESQPGVGWTCFGGPGLSTTTLGSWVPGTSVTRFPEGTGIKLPAGNVLVMQVHYNLSHGDPTGDVTVARLQLAREPVARPAFITALYNTSFSIPPGKTGYSAEAFLTAGGTGVIWGVLPHMHTLGRRIRVDIEGLFGRCLVDIPRWDFHWQQLYFYSNPGGLPIRKGDSVKLTCTWDNTTDRTITWGEGTADEMCLNYFYVSP